MKIVKAGNKDTLRNFFSDDPFLHLYEIGDLDDFFWPYTEWFALEDSEGISAAFLVYKGSELPVLLALEQNDPEAAKVLIREIQDDLPDRIYCHLSPCVTKEMESIYTLKSHGRHNKMKLVSSAYFDFLDCGRFSLRTLSVDDADVIHNLYATAYPGHWFDERMLQSSMYRGLFEKDTLVSIAGIHIFSEKYRVASLGNITTLPAYRGTGCAKIVTAHLCRDLTKIVDTIGLNVESSNTHAINAYKKLGFQYHSSYEEFMAIRIH